MEWIGCTVCEIFTFKVYCDLETGVRGHSVIESDTIRYSTYDIIIIFHSNYASFPRYSHILVENCYPLDIFGAPIGDEAVIFAQRPLVAKTRMMGLSDSERISMTRSAVLTQSTRETDRRTELAWHIRAIAYMLSHVKMLKCC